MKTAEEITLKKTITATNDEENWYLFFLYVTQIMKVYNNVNKSVIFCKSLYHMLCSRIS